jgi:lysyl-tRNA synthetase class 2
VTRGDPHRLADIHGRVLAIHEGTLVVFDAGRVTRHPVSPTVVAAVAPGDLVALGSNGELAFHTAGPGQWPPPSGHPAADLGAFFGDRLTRLAARSRLLQATRAWFCDAGFTEVETPLIVPSPGTETHLDPVAVRLAWHPGAPPEDAWLITSPEYAMKRLLAAGAGPIFQLGRVFRDGERGRNHRPEFTMLEWYRPWVRDGYEALFSDCEALLGHLAGGSELTWRGQSFDLRPPWRRLSFFEALETRADLRDPRRLDPDAWFAALVERVEPTLGAEAPEFLVEWPASLASLARRKADDPEVAERFELYLGGLELANAFAELTDADEQRARCEADNVERLALGRPELPLDPRFLGALTAGMPPSAGIALGFDRLAMLLLDAGAIDDVVAF